MLLLVMTVVFMLFEVRHVPYKMRFALNNPQIHIAGLHRALKGVSHYLALKTLLSLWTGIIVWLGLELMGAQFALMWAVLAFLLNYVPNIGAVISAVPPMIQVLLFNGIYEMYSGRRIVFSGPYGHRQYFRTTDDGPSPGDVHHGGISFIVNLGMAARPGRDATFGAINQRV